MRLCTAGPGCRGGHWVPETPLRGSGFHAVGALLLWGPRPLVPAKRYHLGLGVLAEGLGESTPVAVVHRPRLGLVFSVSVGG